MESINSMLGPGYQVLVQGGNPVIVQKEPFENLGMSEFIASKPNKTATEIPVIRKRAEFEPTFDDRIFQFYIGSLSVVGLFMLFRFIQKHR